MDDFRHTADRAYAAVDVPDSVVDILAELRCYLQDKCEPPMYVSDRRFMKAVQMLQVRWHCESDGAPFSTSGFVVARLHRTIAHAYHLCVTWFVVHIPDTKNAHG